MKIQAIRSVLLRELTLLASVVDKKSSIPVLANIYVETTDDWHVVMRATDLDVWLTSPMTVFVKEPGRACLPAKKLLEIVKALPESDVEITADATSVTVTCLKSRFKLPAVDPDTYPELPESEAVTAQIEVSGLLLRLMIEQVQCAISMEESRYTLNGAKFDATNGQMQLAASDGHRLSHAVMPIQMAESSKLDVLIPRKTLAEIPRLLADAAEKVTISQRQDDNRLTFAMGSSGRVLVSRLLSGQFPNIEPLLKTQPTHTIQLPAEVLATAIKRVSLMADERSRAVRLEFAPGRLTIAASTSEAGEAGEHLDIESEIEMTCAFNATYLLDGLALCGGDVCLGFRTAGEQALLTPAESANGAGESPITSTYIVMPMRA